MQPPKPPPGKPGLKPGQKAPAGPPPPPAELNVADIDRCVQTGIYEKTYSAAACIAAVGAKPYHRAVYGNPTHPPPHKKLAFDTVFDLASLTKPLGTGLAALWLASKNRIDLNASLAKTLPEWKLPKFEKVTLDMLLDHTSGLPAVRSFWKDIHDGEAKLHESQKVLGKEKAREVIKHMLADVTMEADPGTKTVYSDVGFIMLGYVIEHITSMPLDVFLEREIYKPLGLQNDLFFVRLDDPNRHKKFGRRVFAATEDCPWRKKVLQGEVHDPNAWAMNGVAGHAGLFGTIDGVYKLMVALWESYKGDGRHFLGGTVKRFWTRSKRLPNTTRALAWDTPTVNNSSAGKRFSQASIGHLGFTGCSVWLDLSTDIMGVFLANAVHPTPDKDGAMQKLRPRLYEVIAKQGEAEMQDSGKATGAAAFYSGPIQGPAAGKPGMPLKRPPGR